MQCCHRNDQNIALLLFRRRAYPYEIYIKKIFQRKHFDQNAVMILLRLRRDIRLAN